jgi:hypothetical protein
MSKVRTTSSSEDDPCPSVSREVPTSDTDPGLGPFVVTLSAAPAIP